MDTVTTLVVCSADCVSANKYASIEKAFADHDHISIVTESVQMLLSEDQQQTLPVQDPLAFCKGAVAACVLESKEAIDFAAIRKAVKLSDAEMYTTSDPYFVTKLGLFLFPQQHPLERTVMVCSPPLSGPHREAIVEQLTLKGVFVLSHEETACSDHPILRRVLFHDEDPESKAKCTLILCESFGAVSTLNLSIGCHDDDNLCQLSQKYAPDSWKATYSEHGYRFAQSWNPEHVEELFPNPLIQRTLALIKPTAVSKGYVGDIVEAMEQHGFTIISRKRVHLKAEHAQHFYKVQRIPWHRPLPSLTAAVPARNTKGNPSSRN